MRSTRTAATAARAGAAALGLGVIAGVALLTAPTASSHGYTDSPDLGTAELGNAAFEAIIGAVAEAFVGFTHEAEAARS